MRERVIKISSRDLSEVERLKELKQTYLNNAEKFKDPDYIPEGSTSHPCGDFGVGKK